MPQPSFAAAAAAVFPKRLDTDETLTLHLDGLVGRDPRLVEVRARAGDVNLRSRQTGFAGMAQVICGQQLSVASASAIWGRLSALPGALEPARFLLLDEPALRGAGLSAGKVRSIQAVAAAVAGGELDFAAIEALPAEEAILRLTAIKGVGPWTAEIYLLFCARHPDIFPAGDLALKKAVAAALGLAEMPSTAELVSIATAWSPHRGAAALLFWRYFHALNDRAGIAV